MKLSLIFWIVAVILTIATAVFQRMTGPTYPIAGSVKISNSVIKYSLDRSHGGDEDHQIKIKTSDDQIEGVLEWKRYKTNDEWTSLEMNFADGFLSGTLPHQPPAGKLIYKVKLTKGSESIYLNHNEPVIIRFKGEVPVFIIIPHVILIFLAMLFSTRAGLEYFTKQQKFEKLTYWTLGFLITGGMIFGPIMQYYAFGEFWTGVPFGIDLTDNKTLIALIGWLFAFYKLKRSGNPGRWILFASILMFIIYLIPHSLLGSELDYSEN